MADQKTLKIRFKVKEKNSACFYVSFSHQETLQNVYKEVQQRLEETDSSFIDLSLYLGNSKLDISGKTLAHEGLVSGDTLFVHLVDYEPLAKDRKDDVSSSASSQDRATEERRVPPLNPSSVNWTDSSSVKKFLGEYPSLTGTNIDKLVLLIHMLLLECGFEVLNPHPDYRFLPQECNWKSGTKVLHYGVDVENQLVPIKVVVMEIGASLAVHGSVLGKRISYVIKSTPRFADLSHARDLAISFKNQFALLLLYASGCNVAQLSYFPNEVILNIAKSLDYKSALKWSETASHFRKILGDNRLWRFYYRRDYPKTYDRRTSSINPDWLKLYKEETLAIRSLRKSRENALVVFVPPGPEPFVHPSPPIFPPLLPELPGPFGPPILPGPAPFINRDIEGIAGNYEEGYIGSLQPRRRHDFAALGRPPSGGHFGGGFGRFL